LQLIYDIDELLEKAESFESQQMDQDRSEKDLKAA
jgi:hypothetical protein